MSLSRPWNTDGGPTENSPRDNIDWRNSSADQIIYIGSLFCTKQCYDTNRAPFHIRGGENRFDFVYNSLRFSGIHVAIPVASLDKHIDERRARGARSRAGVGVA